MITALLILAGVGVLVMIKMSRTINQLKQAIDSDRPDWRPTIDWPDFDDWLIYIIAAGVVIFLVTGLI